MLRYSPTKIGLTSFDLDDLDDLDRRLAGRYRSYGSDFCNVRLCAVPSYETKRSITPVSSNAALRRAHSSESEARLYTSNDEHSEGLPITFATSQSGSWIVTTPSDLIPRSLDHTTIPVETVRPSESAAQGHLPPVRVPPPVAAEVAGQSCGTFLDGTNDTPTTGQSATGDLALMPQEIQSCPLLARASARRLNARSELEQVDEASVAAGLQRRPNVRHFQHNIEQTESTLEASNTVQFHETSFSTLRPNTALDPNAPVFMPRTRFGSAVDPSTDHGSGHGLADLRIRPLSEQNVEPQHRRRPANGLALGLVASQEPSHLERYPILRPPPQYPPRQNNGASRHSPITRRVSSGLPLRVSSHPRLGSDASNPNEPYHMGSVASARFDSEESRLSTPTLLRPPQTVPHTHSGGSLSWSRATSRSPSMQRIPSMVSAASGISSTSGHPDASRTVSRQSSKASLNAITEFLRQRSSPLAELSDRLSKLSTADSFGRSRNFQDGRSRVSLLSGDPFRQGSPSEPPEDWPPSSNARAERATSEQSITAGLRLVPLGRIEDTAVPTSSPLPSSPPALPSTPPAQPIPSPRKPLAQLSPARAQASPQSRRTPRVRIYNDDEASQNQPQTPADIGRSPSARRARNQADSAMQHANRSITRRFRMASPPVIPERHRNTYPAATPTARPVGRTGSTSPHHASNVTENDVGARPIERLEEDRRAWLGRPEDGELNATALHEGRSERFLA